MLKIGVVGDLSLQDPARLAKAMQACYLEADMICQVGDMHPGYDVVKHYATKGKPVYAIPGNHDTDWDGKLGWPKQWKHDNPECHMIGLDNSQDRFIQADWDLANGIPKDDLPVIVFCHKPLSTIVLPDGSESNHNMGEAPTNADAVKLQELLKDRDVLYVHGHYHSWSYMKTHYGDCLIEGRGGAAPQIGYTIIIARKSGLVIHSVTL